MNHRHQDPDLARGIEPLRLCLALGALLLGILMGIH